jgi:hypothetical protein
LGLVAEALEWGRRATSRTRILGGAVAGALAGWAAWNLYRPEVGTDGIYYHLPEVVAWVHNGQPGSDLTIHSWLHVGSYPVANEVLLAWSMGLSRSLVPLGVVNVVLVSLVGVGAWVALRSLGVAPFVRWLAVAAMVTVPFFARQVDGPANDVPALAWLVCAAGLAAAARERPALLCPMLIAAGLAIGSKTTALGFGRWAARLPDPRSWPRWWAPLGTRGPSSSMGRRSGRSPRPRGETRSRR